MKYKLYHQGRQPGNLYFDSWVINGYEITLEMTVGAGIRVNIRRPPDEGWCHYWFCGDSERCEPTDILRLVNAAIDLIQNDKLHQAPRTTERPYTKDEKFCRFIEPYSNIYVESLDEQNILGGYIDVIRKFSNKQTKDGHTINQRPADN